MNASYLEIKKNNFKDSTKTFFFPFSPLRVSKSIKLLFFLAILVALKILFVFLSIKISIFNLTISVSWIPIILIGWYYGPIYGLIFGAIADTLTFVAFPSGLWFWLYAIQEPLVAFLSGIVAGIFRLRQKSINNNKIYVDIISSQVICISFCILSLITLLYWLNNSLFMNTSSYKATAYTNYKWIAFSLILCFLATYEACFFINIKKKCSKLTFVYSSLLVMVLMLIFSFLLGSISAIEYLKFINNNTEPAAYAKYGIAYYFLPRVAIEAIKVPIEFLLLFSLIMLIDKRMNSVKNNYFQKWDI